MAEFCKKCYIEKLATSQEEINNIKETYYDDFCESCGKVGPVVDCIISDMSSTCGAGYYDMVIKEKNKEITSEEFQDWYNKHCHCCKWMSDVCMYGEE